MSQAYHNKHNITIILSCSGDGLAGEKEGSAIGTSPRQLKQLSTLYPPLGMLRWPPNTEKNV